MRAGNLMVFALFSAVAALAQTGTITGTIVTLSGGTPVPKAPIRAKNTVTGASFSAQSATNGNYMVTSLPPGTYEISAELPPLFLPFRQENIPVQARQTTHVDIHLDDGQLNTLGDGGDDFVKLVAEQPAPAGRTPLTRDGKPDLTGVWLPALHKPLGAPPEPLPCAEALVKERGENLLKDSPMSHCLPMGISFSGSFLPYRFVQTPTLLVIIDENDDPARQIYLDGRSHPKDPNPSFMGHSVGRWEGDTLVVDTVGFNDRGWLGFDNYPQSEKLRVTERYRRPDLGHLELEITFDDPSAFKKPWKMKRVSSLAPKDMELLEYICAENNRDTGHLVGR
jgi:hypothetical protein